ncbi:MAG: suppressor of loss of ypt1 [Vezdaea aestivalis]|nr:MAG: suppressor of loss of ypt1 [Vezdaea aestivalis]
MSQADQFPDLQEEPLHRHTSRSPAEATAPHHSLNGMLHSDRWHPRKESLHGWGNGAVRNPGRGHSRQKSLTDALRTIRTRRGSVSQNAQEIAEALKAPVSPKLIFLCVIWYLTSALTNTSSKSILNAFRKPVTLTVIQFAFVSLWCLLFAYLARIHPRLSRAIPALKNGIRKPTPEVLKTTLPLAVFQVGGHLLSSTATSRIPVSLVHTIKGLSPLFTVLAYRFIYRIHYKVATYLSLIPLTLGVMLACSADFTGNFFGVLCAFGGAIIFVTQNIFSKRLFNEAARAEADGLHQQTRKLDKLNLLCYSSGLAFLLTLPIWVWSEGGGLFADFLQDGQLDLSKKRDRLGSGRLAIEFLFNGTFHFGQNIMAFILLSMVSPVTYSVASLVKRIFVIVVAVVWFGNSTTSVQAAGIALTFVGLYLYDRTSDAAKGDKKAKLREIKEETLLPLATNHSRDSPVFIEAPQSATTSQFYGNGVITGEEKKNDNVGPGRIRSGSNATWVPPGTRQEETWRPRDMNTGNGIPAQ